MKYLVSVVQLIWDVMTEDHNPGSEVRRLHRVVKINPLSNLNTFTDQLYLSSCLFYLQF